MRHRIFVHVGLPKTATTSLQTDFFPSLAGEEIEYPGVCQPRDSSVQSGLYRAFLAAINGRADVTGLREILSRGLATKTLVLSEEMITVTGERISWRGKLANLKTILEGFDYGIIVTVRDPVAALFSYYCEIYPKLGAGRRSFIDCALNNEAMHIFHYGKLITELSGHFVSERIHFFKFEDMVAGRVRELAGLLTGGGPVERANPLGNHNQRPKTRRRVLTPHYFTAADLLCDVFPGLERAGKKGGSKMLIRLLKLGRHLRLRPIMIEVPEPDVMLRLAECLRAENQTLAQQFGLKY